MSECALHFYLSNVRDAELESDVVGDAAVNVLAATQIRKFGLHADDYASVLRHSQRWNYGRVVCIDSVTYP